MSPKEMFKFIKKISPFGIFRAIASSIWKFSKGFILGKVDKKKGKDSKKSIKESLLERLAIIKKVLVELAGKLLLFAKLAFVLLLIIGFIVFFMMFWNTLVEALGGFRGVVNVDISKMQELNQDTSAYIDIQNKEGLLNAFYEDVSSTSFYQTFNLRDMNEDSIDPVTLFLANLGAHFSGQQLTVEQVKTNIYAQRKYIGDQPVYSDNPFLAFSSIITGIQFDNRYIYTDANKNPVRYLKQAELLGTDDTRQQLNAYFRDYFNREATFTLSPTLLYELNEWAYGTTGADTVVYPEAFTKPIAFANDFRRIKTDPNSSAFGEDYVYVTQRITLDDIRDITSPYYGKYAYEGTIYSTPSDIVWDYAIVDTNRHEIKRDSESSNVVNIGNVSQYATETLRIVYGVGEDGVTVEKTGTGGGLSGRNPTFSGNMIVAHPGQTWGIGDSLMVGVITNSNGSVLGGTANSYQSVSSTTTAAVGATVSQIKDLASRVSKAEYIYISAGANSWFSPQSSFVQQYTALVDTLVANNPGATITFSSIPYFDVNKMCNNGYPNYCGRNDVNSTIQARNNDILNVLRIAGRKNSGNYPTVTFRYYDLYALTNGGTYKAGDGLHLTNDGYKAWISDIETGSIVISSGSGYVPSLGNQTNTNEEANPTPSPFSSTNPDGSGQTTQTGNKTNKDDLIEASTPYDTTTALVKVYWKVNDDCLETQMGLYGSDDDMCEANMSSNKCFIGPFLNMEVDEATHTIQLSELITDEVYYAGNTITREMNKCPKRHLQTADIFDKDDNMLVSSRNLFNKTYIRQRTVKPSYRNSDAYWAQLADFVEEDLSRDVTYTSKDSSLSRSCDEDALNWERGLAWENRQCSVIRHYVCDKFTKFAACKLTELTSWIGSGFEEGEFGEIDIDPTTVYRILMEYEDWLIAHGTHGVEWEYKYFATSNEDRLKGITQFTHINTGLFGTQIPDFLGIKDLFSKGNNKITYQDTFQAYIKSNDNIRTLATEYVPVAIVSQNIQDSNGDYSAINNIGWGWKYYVDANGNDAIKLVKGEASLEFPDYYTTNSNDFEDLFTERLYADAMYGEVNFIHHWENGNIVKSSDWNRIKASLIAGGIFGISDYAGEGTGDAQNVTPPSYMGDVGDFDATNIVDVRNDEYVWNPDVEVWRPTVTGDVKTGQATAVMTSCKDGNGTQCGRITTFNSPDDYLPMEVKSVRDYGLGSVLSYIEGRKVVFKTGVGAGEEYNIEGVEKYFVEMNKSLNGKGFGTSAIKGFYPIQLLDQKVTTAEGNEISLVDVYRKLPPGLTSLEQLPDIASSFTTSQGTGMSSVQINGKTCIISGLSTISMGSQYSIQCQDESGNYVDTGLYAFIPHITDSTLIQAFGSLFNDKNVNSPDQFWDPMGYYLAWFDYAQEYDPDDIWSKRANIISEGFSAYLDTGVAALLREIKLDGNPSFAGTSTKSPWLQRVGSAIVNNADVFPDSTWFDEAIAGMKDDFGNLILDDSGGFAFWGNAGRNISSDNRAKFFEQYGNDINAIDLIDRGQTQRLYLIEEAATFLGEFLYTYEDTMEDIGQMNTENAIVNDVVWADRYYYLSNLNMMLSAKKYTITKRFGRDSGSGCDYSPPSSDGRHDGNTMINLMTALFGNENSGTKTTWDYVYDVECESRNDDACSERVCTTDPETKEETCETEHYSSTRCTWKTLSIENTYDYSESNFLKIDTPQKLTQFVAFLDKEVRSGELDSDTRDRLVNGLWLNTKVYDDLSNWAAVDGSNTSDLNNKFVHDYTEPSSTYKYVPYRDGIWSEWTGNTISSQLTNRTGFLTEQQEKRCDVATASSTTTTVEDTSCKISLNNGQLTENTVINIGNNVGPGKLTTNSSIQDYIANGYGKKMTDADINELLRMLYEYGLSLSERNGYVTADEAEKVMDLSPYGGSSSESYMEGKVLSDNKEDLVFAIEMADRADEGYPLPLFEHISGTVKQISPKEISSFFNGESLPTYQKRIAFKESDDRSRYSYLVSLREDATSYLYDYLTNFEAYVPLDVKEDGELEVRGYSSLLSVRVNYNSPIDKTTQSIGEISNSMQEAEWQEALKKFEGTSINESSASQFVAGGIEVTIKKAPEKMIYLYNRKLASAAESGNPYKTANGMGIKEIVHSEENLNAISAGIDRTINYSDHVGETYPSLVTVELDATLVDGSVAKQRFYLMTVGPGAIESTKNIVFNGDINSDVEDTSLPNYYPFVPDTVSSEEYGNSGTQTSPQIINIDWGNDDRMSSNAITFASKKMARLVNSTGNQTYAAFAYLYGEPIWTAVVNILASSGTSNLQWDTLTKDQWATALNNAIKGVNPDAVPSFTASDIDTKVWSTSAVKDVLSYIQDANARTDAIQSVSQGTFVDTDNFGEYSSTSNAVYHKWQAIIDKFSAKYGVDKAFISAIWSTESTGSAFAGICAKDNIAQVCDNGIYNGDCKHLIACATTTRQGYNGGGGIGQIHDVRGTGGTGSGAGNGGGGGWVREITSYTLPDGQSVECINSSGKTCGVTIHNVKTEFSGDITNPAVMGRWMQIDTRYDPETGAEWSIIYLANLLKDNDYDYAKAAVAYNAGQGGLNRWIRKAKENGMAENDWYSYYRQHATHDYWGRVSSFWSSELQSEGIVLVGGAAAGQRANWGAYKNTGAYNAYQEDKVGVQNTGIELRGKAGSVTRKDVDAILVSATKSDDLNVKAYEYDLFSFFNQDAVVGGTNAVDNGDWVVSANIAQLGNFRALSECPQNEFTGLPPLFHINGPLGATYNYHITSPFGLRTHPVTGKLESVHTGIDIGSGGKGDGTNTPEIYPMAPGIVSYKNTNTSKSEGVAITVDHSSFIQDGTIVLPNDGIITNSAGKTYRIIGVRSQYYHMIVGSNEHLSLGDAVGINDIIGKVGSTGRSTGNHLHFEIRVMGQELDADGNVVKTTSWIPVDGQLWLTSIWTDDAGNQLQSYNVY